ncbi:DEAD/DEAH box helicase family protein [Candidatus Uhrbacteria bacterium]|nr:DEAD/DEAH box helicase family protein [Candidatus Uhrbacteria bacterium]
MKLQFDATQEYQLKAIEAVTDLFRGQVPFGDDDFGVALQSPTAQMMICNEFIIGNGSGLDEGLLLNNLREIQARNGLVAADRLKGKDFTVEMETGTGKTYVYLRTIHELHRKHGFRKFIVVVPGLAVKEGVWKNLEITRDHFDLIYGRPKVDFHVYDPKKRGQMKAFATNDALQVLVINIDSFAKFSESKRGQNIIYQDSDWGVPIECIRGVRPIVIVDEPQNMETDIRRKAIENLNPLCTLRYSATHKNPYNQVYRLDPVQAYDLGLVKRIEVDSVMAEADINQAFVAVDSITSKKNVVTAKIAVDADKSGGKGRVERKTVTVWAGSDLFRLSNGRELYRDGFIVDEIDVDSQTVTFSNGQVFRSGQDNDVLKDEVMRYQVAKAVENHFDKELELAGKGIKALTLFFIDRVANYRTYGEDGTVGKGKIAVWFEGAVRKMQANPKYHGLVGHAPEKIHGGYFSVDKKGLRDTNGNTAADDDTYSLIMKDKERLLSLDEPIRFIFSHSALREGWDNPNVFQICTLNETKSDMKKRQEIGRGMRLPVNQDGQRIFDDSINILTVVANESYEDFAKRLQQEIEDESGVRFDNRIKNRQNRVVARLRKGYALDQNFLDLWNRIKHRTRYQVDYDSGELVRKASELLKEIPVTAPNIVTRRAALEMSAETGVVGKMKRQPKTKRLNARAMPIPDILGRIQDHTKLTKDTILEIVKASGRGADIIVNPQQFIEGAVSAINTVLNRMMIDGIKYEKITGQEWEMQKFENEELYAYLGDPLNFSVSDPGKTLFDNIACDSAIEKSFAADLESNEDIQFYFKLPYWFRIETPIGKYNPDWAIVMNGDKKIYFVAETKSTIDINDLNLRDREQMKMLCGERHFAEFKDVRFRAPIKKVSEILNE